MCWTWDQARLKKGDSGSVSVNLIKVDPTRMTEQLQAFNYIFKFVCFQIGPQWELQCFGLGSLERDKHTEEDGFKNPERKPILGYI